MSNPVLNDNFYSQERVLDSVPMTVSGTINKILVLLACVFTGAIYNWSLILSGHIDQASVLGVVGLFVALIAAVVVIITREKTAKYLSPVYALAEGLFLGGVSAYFEEAWRGIVIQAIAGTFIVLLIMLSLYRSNLIRFTEKFNAVLMTSLLSVVAIYVIQLVASFFGRGIPAIFESGIIGIAFSIIIIGIAAMSLIQDFWFIEEGAKNLMPKDMEWYAAFGIMLTLVWLYLEILKLLAKLNSRE